MSELRAKAGYLVLSLAVLTADQWSKWQAELHLEPNFPESVIPGFFNLTLVRNSGVAFGLFAAGGNLLVTALLTIAGLGALVIVGLYFVRTSRDDKLLLTSLALILGGAVGNLVDRIASGAVTDFLDFYYGSYHFHTFNIADSAITVGICLMALDILRPRGAAVGEPQSEAAGGGSGA